MNTQEVNALLALIGTMDPSERWTRVNADMVLSWAEVLAAVPLVEARDAVFHHYRSSRFPVMPADIVAFSERAAAERVEVERRRLAADERTLAAQEREGIVGLSELSDERRAELQAIYESAGGRGSFFKSLPESLTSPEGSA